MLFQKHTVIDQCLSLYYNLADSKLKYMGAILQNGGDITEDVTLY